MKFAVIGDPIDHSLSPAMHRVAYDSLGLRHTYEAVRVHLDGAFESLDRLRTEGYEGVNVTVPLKEAAFAWSQPDEFARRAGAVNTLRLADRAGVNTDGPGMANVIRARLGRLTGVEVLLLGAGGSSRAIAHALSGAGARVVIWNRTHAKAVDVAAAAKSVAEAHPDLEAFDVIINSTSSSMAGQLPTLFSSGATIHPRPGSAAIDLYYSAGGTIFQKACSEIGWDTWDGRELLVAQGALAFEFWLGVNAPLEAMRAAVGL